MSDKSDTKELLEQSLAVAVDLSKLQQLKPPGPKPEPPPPLADYKDIVSYNAYTGLEQKLTMGLATAKRGRARRAIIALKANISVMRMRWFGRE